MAAEYAANPGSFRDPQNQVYEFPPKTSNSKPRILRGVSNCTLATFKRLLEEKFYKQFVDEKYVVSTSILPLDDSDAVPILSDGWGGVLEHEAIPFISYPYEWTFSMLKDAALLQLHIIEQALENGWTLKDATPFNVQFVGSRPIFIDISSFEPWFEGDPWVGYRQFCSMFLTPLMLRAHLGLDHLPIMRSYLDGIPPTEAIKFFNGLNRLKKGVLSHISFPAGVENSIAKRERDNAPAQQRIGRKQTKAMVIGLVQSISRLVKRLTTDIEHTDWSQYDKTHSYKKIDFDTKKAFVEKQVARKSRDIIWDIGCNTGIFSRICSQHCNRVVSIDGDHDAVEQLYLEKRKNGNSNILPLVMDLANLSPGQGWDGNERQAFDRRKKPDLVLCLAMIHHIRFSSNIPNLLFLRWLSSLKADVVLEFVSREDEMVVKLLTNKKEQYADYNLEQFISEANQFFTIEDRELLKGGKREIFFLSPR
ncbi:MAG: class I SAM-dependent methyltransferase [Desulfobulbaceae bacterium]|nr:class I SAM-dependent methyltransferase [Desulfobulbaceae bacterium]